MCSGVSLGLWQEKKMVKNAPLKAGQMRQSSGSVPSGNAKAVAKRTTYTEPREAATGRTATMKPASKPLMGRGTC